MTELGLGCVQLGIPYGNAAKQHLMGNDSALKILQFAAEKGIKFYDTAIAYGESENRIGQSEIARKFPEIEIATKIPPVSSDVWQSERRYWKFLEDNIENSRKRLHITRFSLLQFHQCDLDFLTSASTQRMFDRLLEQQLCRQIGISVYSTDQVEACLTNESIQAVQVPFNIIDQRFFTAPLVEKYQTRNIRVIGRSIFLQGVLLPNADLPDVKKSVLLKDLRRLLESRLEGYCLHELTLSHAKFAFPEIIKTVILGVDTLESLKQNLNKWSQIGHFLNIGLEKRLADVREFVEHHGLVNPSCWND